jgi:hypothetical protein
MVECNFPPLIIPPYSAFLAFRIPHFLRVV